MLEFLPEVPLTQDETLPPAVPQVAAEVLLPPPLEAPQSTALMEVAIARMVWAEFTPVPAFNPCWDRCGRTFEDPDGYRVVIQQANWKV